MAQKMKSGRWRARVRIDGKLQSLGVYRTKKEAEAEEDKAKTESRQGRFVDRTNSLTVSEYAWTFVGLHGKRESTQRRMATYVRAHIDAHPLGARPVTQVQPTEVKAWIKDRSSYLAAGTMRNLFGFLRQVFDAAIDDRHITVNPCSTGASKSLPERKRKKFVPLTTDQVDALAAEIADRYRAMVYVQAGCGLRIGELLALGVEHVDFLRREVHVERQLAPGARDFSPPKTEGSVRTVPLPEVAALALSEHIRNFPPVDGLLFTSTFGNCLRHDYYGAQVFKRAALRAGLPPETTPHDLRHHFATELVDAGVSVYGVAELLGHTTPALVISTYGHAKAGTVDVARKALEDAWAVARATNCATEDAASP
jgi:integrase